MLYNMVMAQSMTLDSDDPHSIAGSTSVWLEPVR
jgi:hypothetical protein